MIPELNTQKPEFIVQDGAIRLLKIKVSSGGAETFFADREIPALKMFLKQHEDALVKDFPQEDYQEAEGLTGDMLTYLPDEEVLDFDHCSQERLAMIIQKYCRRKQPVPPVDPLYEEFLKEERLAAFQKACQTAIAEGVEVAVSEGTKKFSLTLQDQINLMSLRGILGQRVLAGDMKSPTIPYHADGEPMRLWSGSDIQKILQSSDDHIMHHRVYYNLLREWVRRTSYPEFLDIDYGDALPDDLAQNLATILVVETAGVRRR